MKPALLLVDDEPDMLDLLGDLFEDEFRLVKAESAPEALEALTKATDVRLAIVDYMMPGGDGLTLVRSLRERGSELPVILYSAFLDSQDGEWEGGLRLRVVSKSEPVDVLVRTVREIQGEVRR